MSAKPGRVKVKIKIRFHAGPLNQVETCARLLRTRPHITVCSIHSPRITLTLFSLLPCRPSSTRRPRRFPQRSRTTRTRRYSSRITSISSKLRSAPCARWHTERSTPCTSSHPSPTNRYRGCFPLADEDCRVLLARVPTSLDRALHMQLVSTYYSLLS